MDLKKYIAGALVGMGLGVLANSYDVRTSEEFMFTNPIPSTMNIEEQLDLVSHRPRMTDTIHSLDLFGNHIPLKTIRTVTNPITGDSFEGRLSDSGDIYAQESVYRLQSAHDSLWYTGESSKQ